MRPTRFMPSFYPEKKPRKRYMSKKRRNQEIIDEADDVQREDTVIWIILWAILVFVIFGAFFWIKPL